MHGLLAASSSDGFSLPVIVTAAAVAVVWVAGTAALRLQRRPAEARAAPATMQLGGEPPALASLLCDDYEVRAEAAPATLLDLAARDVIALDEVQPGQTICRVPPSPAPADEELASFERHVLAALRTKAVDGVVPATALTTGTEDASARWHRDLAQLIVSDAQQRGLTVDRWSRVAIRVVGAGAVAVVGLLLLSAQLGGDAEDDPVVAGIAAAVAIGGALVLGGTAGRMRRSLAQRPTPAGSATESGWLGVRAHLAQNPQLPALPPASVTLYGRHLAYAAAFGLADRAVTELPFGEEDDHLAWSAEGGRWRRVRVRYPRVRPPGWGRHPAIATALAVMWALIAAYLFDQLVRDAGTASIVVAAVLAIPMAWSAWVLSAAVPDLFTTRTVSGSVVRGRTRNRRFSSNDPPKYWYYVAIDDGSRDRITAYRVSEEHYRAVRQGQTVVAEVTPRLGYVRTLG